MDTTVRVPVLDISNWQQGTSPPREIVAALGDAFSDIGFVTVTGHGIRPGFLDALYDEARKVFSLPRDTLLKYERPKIGRQRGYTPMGGENARDQVVPDLKQFWHVGPENHAALINVWPVETPLFRMHTRQLFRELTELGRRLLDALDQYLGLSPGTLRGFTENGNTLLRVLHYPPVQADTKGIRSAAHEDINLITLLVAATASGLQVRARNGQWVAVNETPGSLVVNVGDMLQMLTNGRLISTTHRVVNPPQSDTSDRLSVPLFIHPRPGVVLHTETGYTADEYLTYRLVEIGLMEGTLSAMRPPPNVSGR